MYLVTIQPKPITVLVDTLNADLAEEMARQHLEKILLVGMHNVFPHSRHPMDDLFYCDKSDAKVEKSNEESFGAIYKVV